MDYVVTKAEILGSLSRALDMVEGQPQGHAARTSLIAVRLGKTIGLADDVLDSIFFGALLKDSGCSNNSARIQKLFGGDDLLSKQKVKFVDWSDPIQSFKFGISNTEPNRGVRAKLRRLIENLGSVGSVMDQVTTARCTRGAEIATALGFGPVTSSAVRDLDEHWDGKGSPRHIRRDEIPLGARILCLAQTLEVFFTAFGIGPACQMLESRSGRWFDPELVRACGVFREDYEFWNRLSIYAVHPEDTIEIPARGELAGSADIDNICRAYALIIDAKSSFTWEHSSRVTQYSLEMADAFGFDTERRRTLERAALLHDIGKLGISNSILEKNGKLTEDEYATIRLHPKFTNQILAPIRGFERITSIASAHHERLDGKGYYQGLDASQLDLDMRIVSVADVFDALSAKRPYRDALPIETVFKIMDSEAGTALDPDCIEVMRGRMDRSAVLAA